MDPFFHYEVNAIDELDRSEVIHHHGISTAKTFTEAMEKVVGWYGEDMLINIYIEFCNDGGPLVFDEGNEKLFESVMELF